MSKQYTWAFLWQEIRLLICYWLWRLVAKIAPRNEEGRDLIHAMGAHARNWRKK